MVYYLGLIGMICLFRLISLRFSSRTSLKKFYFAVAVLVILFQGLRSFSVGTDLAAYLPAYLDIGENLSIFKDEFEYMNFEPGYVLLNKILYICGFDRRMFLICMAAIIQIPIFVTLYKNSTSPLLSILIYFAFGNFLMTFSGLRQAIVMSLCFSAYSLIKDKKIIPFFIVILFSALFHKSGLFCLILYPLYHLKLKKRYFPLMVCAIGLIFIFRKQVFEILSILYYGEAIETSNTGAYTMFFMYVLLFFVSFINPNPTQDYIGLRNILLLLVCIYALASVHDYVTRIGFPLSVYLSLFVPKVIESMSITKKSMVVVRIFSILVCVGCFCYFCGTLGTLPFSFL